PQPEQALLEAVNERWGERVRWHLEAVRQGGCPRLASLPLVRMSSAEELDALMAFCRERGAVIFDPHALTVEEGGLGVIDADQVAAKAAHDPAGLLNPGKLGGWVSRSPG
ncbi:MAG: FAD-binding protein, partial [Cyanobium sp.]